MEDNERRGGELARAAAHILTALATSGAKGAAITAAEEAAPFLIKLVAGLLLLLLLIPMLVFTAMPNMFFGYEGSGVGDVTHMTQQAMTQGGVYLSLEDKLAPEEFPDYGTLKSCRVTDYTPEWRLKEEQAQAQKKDQPVSPKPKTEQESKQEPEQKAPDPMDEPNPTKDLEYQFNAGDNSLGIVELGPAGVVGGEDEDEGSPPGR